MTVPGPEVLQKWKTFSWTQVDYPEGDVFGKILAVLSLSPWVIAVIFVTIFCVKRDLHTFFYGTGIVTSEVINFALKNAIKEPRPEMERDPSNLAQKYGMPSSHSQFMFFVATYNAMFVFIRLRHQESSLLKVLWSLLIFCISGLVAYGRIYLQYHTISQVGWGIVVGTLLAFAWFFVVHILLTPWFPVITSWRFSEYFMIRDYTTIPNVMWFDYLNARSEAKNRFRKLSKAKKQR